MKAKKARIYKYYFFFKLIVLVVYVNSRDILVIFNIFNNERMYILTRDPFTCE